MRPQTGPSQRSGPSAAIGEAQLRPPPEPERPALASSRERHMLCPFDRGEQVGVADNLVCSRQSEQNPETGLFDLALVSRRADVARTGHTDDPGGPAHDGPEPR